jgi:hypothetical protein
MPPRSKKAGTDTRDGDSDTKEKGPQGELPSNLHPKLPEMHLEPHFTLPKLLPSLISSTPLPNGLRTPLTRPATSQPRVLISSGVHAHSG